MRILVAGTGALACVYAAFLERVSEHEVVLFGTWQEQLDAIDAEGITILGPVGAETFRMRVAVCRDARDLEGQFDLVVLATKAYQLEQRVLGIVHLLGPDTIVFGVQNGLTVWERLDRALGDRATLLAGESMVAATKAGPGVVRVFSLGETLLAPVRADRPVEPAQRAARVLASGQLPARAIEAEELSALLWEKIILTAGMNAVSILLRVPVSGIRSSPAATRVSRRLMEEVRDVAARDGVDLDVDRAFAATEAFGDNRPSGLADFLAGRPTEISDINGAVAERSRVAGLTAPWNELVDELVEALYETAADRIPDTDIERVRALAPEGA